MQLPASAVTCWYIGAYTRQTWEKRAACAIAISRSSGSTHRSEFGRTSVLTVG